LVKHKFAVAGCGVIGGCHAACLTYIENAELVAVYDVVEEKARTLGAKYNCSYYTDIDKMLREQDIEIVNICTPSGSHAECGVICAKAGKHIICEKPIDISEENALKLIKACEEAGVKLSVISQHRFDRGYEELKKAVDSGELGKLYFGGCHTKWYRNQEYYDSGDWRGTWSLMAEERS
jgi:predicted dehydrogenase